MPIIFPVAGGKGGIGKSFISANLGWLLAKENKTVLLADLDLGSANLHTMMGIQDPGTGLNHFLNKTSSDLMETIIPCQIPGLSLLSSKKCSMEAANLPFPQIQKIINAITRLPFDIIFLDLGAGTHFNTLDFFLTSTDVILIFTQEPTSIESGIRFIETVYYRKIKHLFKQNHINAIIKNTDNPSAPSLSNIINLLAGGAQNDSLDLRQCLEKISFKIIINQARHHNGYQVGEALVKLCQRHFYSRFELIGVIDYDEKVLDAIVAKQLFVKKFPRSRTTYDLVKTAHNLVSVRNKTAVPPIKSFCDRNFYEILEIHPETLSVDVRQAYQSMKSLYRDIPMVTDAFFTSEERDRILETIDAAGEVLSDPNKRTEYDRLLSKGHPITVNGGDRGVGSRLPEHDPVTAPPEKPPESAPPQPPNVNESEAMQLIEKISAQQIISGLDLKTLRNAWGISMESIFEKTRIGVATLKIIEEDQFDALPPLIYLKGFLRAYAQALRLPAGTVVDGYLKSIGQKDRKRPDASRR
ncbi:MAG: helix-turn-helix domain-containing protein [Thermodesulfobacteriota bacterium]